MATIADQPLTHCPVCKYDLTGLPTDHRCPECGFEYEESMRLWVAPALPRWTTVMRWFVLVSFPFAMGSMLAYEKTGRVPLPTELVYRAWPVFVFWYVLFTPFFILPEYIMRKCPSLLVLGKEGLFFRRPFNKPQKYRWAELVLSGWAVDHLRAEDLTGKRLKRPIRFKLLRCLQGTAVGIGGWPLFRIAKKNHGKPDQVILLPWVVRGLPDREDLQRAVYDRWKRGREDGVPDPNRARCDV